MKEKGLLFLEQPCEDLDKISSRAEDWKPFEHLKGILDVFKEILAGQLFENPLNVNRIHSQNKQNLCKGRKGLKR
ncbi:MAG: hypothetical protein PW786_04750 [Arachidicoccus sp.]|nr:hypothetical protein [Arachidicoccus sp.]